MEQITARALRTVEWKQVYQYDNGKGFRFTTYASDKLPGLTITKEQRGSRRVKTHTTYAFEGRKTDSPTQIVRYWNEKVKRNKGTGSAPAGSPKSAGRPRGATDV